MEDKPQQSFNLAGYIALLGVVTMLVSLLIKLLLPNLGLTVWAILAFGAVLLVYALYSSILLALSPLGLVGLSLISIFRILFFCFFEVPAVGLVLLTRLGTRASPGPVSPPGYPGASVTVPPSPPSAPPPAETPGPTSSPEPGLESTLPSDPSGNRSD